MDQKRDFTIDPVNFAGLPEYVDELRAEGTRFVIILVNIVLTDARYYNRRSVKIVKINTLN